MRQPPADLEVRRAARDLARNLSLHGAGIALFAVGFAKADRNVDQASVGPEIRSAYGARNLWQVIDQVATIDLGGAANASRLRTMATAGSTIISWLATNVLKLRPNVQRPILRIRKSASVPTGLKEFQFSSRTSDSELANASEQWLAVNGVTDNQIDQHSQPGRSAHGTAK